MKAIRLHAFGGPEVLSLEELPDPVPGEGEVVVRVEAAGVNFIDVYQRSGAYPGPLPRTLGLEAAGVVEALGPGAAGFSVGDRVAFTNVPGGYASAVVVPAARLVKVPDGIDSAHAAAAMLQGMTAHYLAHDTYRLGPGKSCLVLAAAGGVGLLLCQLARAAGATVIGAVSSDEKAALAKGAGAHHVIRYDREELAAAARALTGGRGVDVVYDSVGKATFEQSLSALATRGMLALFGQSSGAVAAFDPQVLNQKGSLFLTRPSLGHYTATTEELRARAGAVLAEVAAGRLSLRIHERLPLAEAARAHELLASRRTSGKLLLIP